MTNYDYIAKAYDKIFPLNSITFEFLKNEFNGLKKIVDVGCGSGVYTVALAPYFSISGFDLSENMIKFAKEKNSTAYFYTLKMEDMQDSYDGIYCIGNTLVHLQSYNEIKKQCFVFYDSLNNNGKLIIQILNYEYIINNNITSLLTIENDDLKFYRNYEFVGGIIRFKTKLESKFLSHDDVSILYPLTKNELEEVLKAAGFKRISFKSGFSYNIYDKNIMKPLVVIAIK